MNTEERWEVWLPVLQRELDFETEKAPAVSRVHANDHIHRVWGRCLALGGRLGADMEILVAAVFFHDLGRHYIKEKAHGNLSARLAAPVLERMGFPRQKSAAVLHAIRVHDVTSTPEERNTIESQILYDSDKLDTFGVIGILRYIRYYYGKKPIDFILEDIDARWESIALNETRTFALKEYRYIKDYFERLKEAVGE